MTKLSHLSRERQQILRVMMMRGMLHARRRLMRRVRFVFLSLLRLVVSCARTYVGTCGWHAVANG